MRQVSVPFTMLKVCSLSSSDPLDRRIGGPHPRPSMAWLFEQGPGPAADSRFLVDGRAEHAFRCFLSPPLLVRPGFVCRDSGWKYSLFS